jgi:PAS domain-containing protein
MRKNGFVRDFESEIYRKDKTRIWISENVREVKGDSGELLYYEGFVVDITERKSAENFLRNSVLELDKRVDEKTMQLKDMEKALRLVVNSVDDAIVMLDRDGFVIIANDSSEKRYGKQANTAPVMKML